MLDFIRFNWMESLSLVSRFLGPEIGSSSALYTRTYSWQNGSFFLLDDSVYLFVAELEQLQSYF